MFQNVKEFIERYPASSPKIRKYENYIEFYESLFSKFRNQDIRVLEIGVQHGGSLELWKALTTPSSQIVGLDILPQTKQHEDERVKIFVGDQGDESFLSDVSSKTGIFDIIIDDGSHIPFHQKITFEKFFFENLRDGGVYVVEDCHTSYWRDYGGGLRKSGSFIEFSKTLIDEINAWHGQRIKNEASKYTKSIRSIQFESSMVIFEKAPMVAPRNIDIGVETIDVKTLPVTGSMGNIMNRLRKIEFLRSLVRRSPTLWRLMSKQIGRSRSKTPES
ncbi:class I SAM-dependent methyltransferase [Algihabitans albus]|uniref:class I SAM-dependent methyltransferase n=1 Tax=Algihabitans albus TaxID=2164067 RepID=UPI0013C30CFC|nr:class I SAM-dependent methyltransferase [Algihabitans albus]